MYIVIVTGQCLTWRSTTKRREGGEFAAAVNREAEKEIYEFFSFVWFNIKQEASPACYIPSTQGTFS